MVVLLKQLFSLLQLLNSETGERQIAFGLSLGLILGFSPMLSLQSLVCLLIILLFRVQAGAAFISAFFFAFIAWLIDPVADHVGRLILEYDSFRPLFTTLYNLPIVPFTQFNNSIVMGSGVIGFMCLIPAYFIFLFAIRRYRATLLRRLKDTRFWTWVKATRFFKWYAKYEALYG